MFFSSRKAGARQPCARECLSAYAVDPPQGRPPREREHARARALAEEDPGIAEEGPVEPLLPPPLLWPRQHLQHHGSWRHAIVQHDALQAAEQLAEPALRHTCGAHSRLHPDPRALVHLCEQHQPLFGQGVALWRGRCERAGRGRVQPRDARQDQGAREAAGVCPPPPEPRHLCRAGEAGAPGPFSWQVRRAGHARISGWGRAESHPTLHGPGVHLQRSPDPRRRKLRAADRDAGGGRRRQLCSRRRALPGGGIHLPHCADAGRRRVLGPRARRTEARGGRRQLRAWRAALRGQRRGRR